VLDSAAIDFPDHEPACTADMTTEGDGGGTPDGLVTLSDFAYYLAAWSQSLPVADITLENQCPQAAATTQAGGDGVSLSDFSCYLSLWSQGCN